MKNSIKRRSTKQRKIILEELKKTKSHPTAQMLFDMVRKRLPSIGFATVYRNLNLLKNENKIIQISCGKYGSRYDADTRPHYHFFCIKCNKVLDLAIPIIMDLNVKISKKTKAKVLYHRIDFYGYCKDCKK